MGLTSLQVSMDSSNWFQGTIQDEQGLDSSSPSGISDSMLTCSRPLMERRLRPQHDQALKCPRCDSAHTKFCYYNNYSLTQPRYFCKTCRRYWTKGGTLRNIPVGGGCRKNKKVSKRSNSATVNNNNVNNNFTNNSNDHSSSFQQNPHFINPNPNSSHNHNHNHNHNENHNHSMIMNSTDLQLSNYPETSMQFSASNLFGIGNSNNIPGFMFENLSNNAIRAIDFMENGGGLGAGAGTGAGNYMGIMGNGGYTTDMSGVNVIGQNYHGSNLCSPFGGMTLDSINNPFMERGIIGYNNDHDGNDHVTNMISSLDVKPKLLALEWQDQNATTTSTNGGGGAYMTTGLGSSWGGIMNGFGPSTTNSLV